MSNYYEILEVEKNATIEDIKKNYKKLAFKWHPDKNQDNKAEAEKNFKDISKAYQILSDPNKRKIYDLTGTDESLQTTSFKNEQELFQEFFSNLKDQLFNNIPEDFMMGKFDDILGGPEVKFTIHTFANIPSFEMFQDMPFFDMVDQTKNIFQNMKETVKEKKKIYEDKNLSKITEEEKGNYISEIERLNKKLKHIENKKEENLDIIVNLKIKISDYLIKNTKKIKINRKINKKIDNKYKRCNDEYEITVPLNINTISYPEKGEQSRHSKDFGNLIINVILINDDKIKVFKQTNLVIYISNILDSFTYFSIGKKKYKVNLDLLNNNVLLLPKIGLTRIINNEEKIGDLYLINDDKKYINIEENKYELLEIDENQIISYIDFINILLE
jgi:curved DNA-binding protein CbpA